jgi:hypothetical protein
MYIKSITDNYPIIFPKGYITQVLSPEELPERWIHYYHIGDWVYTKSGEYMSLLAMMDPVHKDGFQIINTFDHVFERTDF